MRGQTGTAMSRNSGIKCNSEHMTGAVNLWVKRKGVIGVEQPVQSAAMGGHVWVCLRVSRGSQQGGLGGEVRGAGETGL